MYSCEGSISCADTSAAGLSLNSDSSMVLSARMSTYDSTPDLGSVLITLPADTGIVPP